MILRPARPIVKFRLFLARWLIELIDLTIGAVASLSRFVKEAPFEESEPRDETIAKIMTAAAWQMDGSALYLEAKAREKGEPVHWVTVSYGSMCFIKLNEPHLKRSKVLALLGARYTVSELRETAAAIRRKHTGKRDDSSELATILEEVADSHV